MAQSTTQNTTQNTTQSATQSATRSEQSDAVVVVSLQEDPEYLAYLANYMAKAAAMTVDEETGEPTEATEPVEPPLPETFVLPMLARLLRGKARCIVDGDPAVFTPAVVAVRVACTCWPRCVTSGTDHCMNIHARITWTVACIPVFFYVYVQMQGRVCSLLTLLSVLLICRQCAGNACTLRTSCDARWRRTRAWSVAW